MIRVLEWPSKTETRSIGTPASSNSTANVCRKRCAWPPETSARAKKGVQAPLPVSHRALKLPLAAPEKILLACAAHSIEGLNHRIGKRAPNQGACLGRAEEKFPVGDPLARQAHDIADPQAGIAKQQHEGPQPARILLAGPSVVVSVGIARSQNAQPLFAREWENLGRRVF